MKAIPQINVSADKVLSDIIRYSVAYERRDDLNILTLVKQLRR